MNKRSVLTIMLVLALIVMLLTGCSPDKKGAEGDTEPAPQEQVTQGSEEQATQTPEEQPTDTEEPPADTEEPSADAEGEPVYEDPELLENDGELSVVVPDDQAFGGF